jgi:surfeit locus 1 family protein
VKAPEPKPRRGGFVLFALFILVAVGVLLALGTWQLDRLSWKEALIAELDAKLSAKPTDLPARERWQRLDRAADEFRRVAFPAEFLTGQEALVYTSGSSLRPDAVGPGYWVFAPARLTGGSLVMVNRGFVPEGKQNPDTRKDGQVAGAVEIAGVMRWPEVRGEFTPKDEPEKGLWFARDPAAMAAAKKWGNVAPFYIDQEAPSAPGGLPKVGPLKASLPNNHLQYAVTWYGLAAVILIAAIVFWRARRRAASP